ncbi:MAG: hypothetical protein ACTSYI_14655 [Promethearchaeota archaeon]
MLEGTLDPKYFDRIRAETTGAQKKFLLENLEISFPEHPLVRAFREDLEISTNNGLPLAL